MRLTHNLFVFALMLLLLACGKEVKHKIIGIQPFEQFSEQDLKVVKDSIVAAYQCQVKYLPIEKVPKVHVTRIKSYRYRADSLLNLLDRLRPKNIDLMLGLTKTDIAITKLDKETGEVKKPVSTYTDWAIFGLGRVNGYSCVVSNYRLKKGVNREQYLTRLTRICNHEVGHVLGLRHCPTKACLMNDANETIRTIDNSTGRLCDNCTRKIR